MISAALDPSEARRLEKELADEVNKLLGAFVIAGIVEPKEEEKKHGTKKKKNSD